MLSNPRDLSYTDSIVCTGVDSDDTYIYTVWTVSSTHVYRKFDPKTLAQVGSDTTVVNTPAGLSLLNSASAVVPSSSANQIDIIELSSGHRNQLTTNANTVFSSQLGQQVAGNPDLEQALVTSSSDSEINLVDPSGGITALTPAEISGDKATCVIAKSATSGLSNTWLFGTNDGKVHEITAAGTVTNTITLPTTPNTGSAPTHIVTGISYYPPNLAATTNQGMFYLYEYESGTLIYQQMVGETTSATNSGPTLCASSSGTTLLASSRTGGGIISSISEVYIASNPPTFEQYFIDLNIVPEESHINASTRKAYLRSQSGSFFSFQQFDMGGTQKILEQTELQDPPGVQITGKIIRIRDDGPGNSTVELVAEVGAETSYLSSTDGRKYIEIALNSDDSKYDIREFEK